MDAQFLDAAAREQAEETSNPIASGSWGAPPSSVPSWDAPMPMTMTADLPLVPPAVAAPKAPLDELGAMVGKSAEELKAMGEEDLLQLMAEASIGTVLKNNVLAALAGAVEGQPAAAAAAAAAAAGEAPAQEEVERWREELARERPQHEMRQAWLDGPQPKIHLCLVTMGVLCLWLLMYSTVEDAVDCLNSPNGCDEDDGEAAGGEMSDAAYAQWARYADGHDTLQLHGVFGSSNSPQKTFRHLGRHSTLSLSFRYFAVGTWDGEQGQVWVDDQSVWQSPSESQGDCSLAEGWEYSGYALSNPIGEDSGRRRRLKRGGGKGPSPPPALNYAQACYTDVSLVIPHHHDTLTLRFGSNLDETLTNEAFFVGDIVATICGLAAAPPAPPPSRPRPGPPPPVPRCNFELGDGSGGHDEYVGEARSPQQCVSMVARSSEEANGVTFQAEDTFTATGSCWAEFHMTGSDENTKFQSCTFRNMSAPPGALESCELGGSASIQTQLLADEVSGFTTDEWSPDASASFSLDWARARALAKNGSSAPGERYQPIDYPLGNSSRLTGPVWLYIIGFWVFVWATVTVGCRGNHRGLDCCGHYRGTAQVFRITGGFDGALLTTATRLVLRGGSHSCACFPGRCGGLALRDEYKGEVPPELLARGVTQAMWREWMDRLDRDVESKAKSWDLCRISTTSYCPWFWCCLKCNMIGAVPFLWHWVWWLTCCCIPWAKYDPYQIALKKYLREFNSVLEP